MVRKSNTYMLNRKIYSYLRNFFVTEKKALLISGARQVGKTFAIRKIGEECFADVVEFNFLNNPKYREAFKSPSDAKEILLRLSALAEKKLTPGNTLVFFDEIKMNEVIQLIMHNLVHYLALLIALLDMGHYSCAHAYCFCKFLKIERKHLFLCHIANRYTADVLQLYP